MTKNTSEPRHSQVRLPLSDDSVAVRRLEGVYDELYRAEERAVRLRHKIRLIELERKTGIRPESLGTIL